MTSVRTLRFSVVFLLSLLAAAAFGAEQPAASGLIPRPAKVVAGEGSFTLSSETVIHADRADADTATVLVDAVARATGLRLQVDIQDKPAAGDGTIALVIDTHRKNLGDEGYELKITPKGVSIIAARTAGLFYGVQTLRQMLPAAPVQGQATYAVACVSIEDVPRFGWRGYMLDSSRHFVRKATILNLLDALAMFKINVFHWHVVDDQAWRLAISKYPDLVKPIPGSSNESSQAEGYYTAEDVREVVERAKRLHIMIVPEIEMPSHATQAASVLPDGSCLGADGKPLPAGTTREICLGSDKAIQALQDVLVETIKLFPDSPYIHLGGDEAEDRHWKACSRCQARMVSLGLADARLMQKWFMDKMNRFVREQGRTSVAWADRLELGIPEGQIVHDWHAGELEQAVAKGHRVICSQHDYTYLDYGQGPGDSAFGSASLTVQRVYELDPVRGATPEQAKLVLGPQAQLWTELVTDKGVFAKTFPRMLALAEVGWTPQQMRNWGEFAGRMEAFLPRLDAMGIPYFAPGVQIGTWAPAEMSESWKDLEWNMAGKIKKPGELNIGMMYQKGEHGLEIESVALLEDGHEISRDAHLGFTGAGNTKNMYQLRVPKLKKDAAYTIRARVRSKGGTDSTGVVLFQQ